MQPSFVGSTTAPSKRKSRYRNELAYRTKLCRTKVTKFSRSVESLVGRKNFCLHLRKGLKKREDTAGIDLFKVNSQLSKHFGVISLKFKSLCKYPKKGLSVFTKKF